MKLIWYNHYINDYFGDTLNLSYEEHGIYRAMIDYCYLLGGSFVDSVSGTEAECWKQNIVEICKIIKPTCKRQVVSVEAIFRRYWTVSAVDGGYSARHKRIDIELQKAGVRTNRARNAANSKKARVITNDMPPPSFAKGDETEHKYQNFTISPILWQRLLKMANSEKLLKEQLRAADDYLDGRPPKSVTAFLVKWMGKHRAPDPPDNQRPPTEDRAANAEAARKIVDALSITKGF